MKQLNSKDIAKQNKTTEFYTPEGLFILESWNTDSDPGLSIARSRVTPGSTTRWHVLDGIDERYLVISGAGLIEIGDNSPKQLCAGDVAFIPRGVRQRISNTTEADLIFYCVCTPRFVQTAYRDVDSDAD